MRLVKVSPVIQHLRKGDRDALLLSACLLRMELAKKVSALLNEFIAQLSAKILVEALMILMEPVR